MQTSLQPRAYKAFTPCLLEAMVSCFPAQKATSTDILHRSDNLGDEGNPNFPDETDNATNDGQPKESTSLALLGTLGSAEILSEKTNYKEVKYEFQTASDLGDEVVLGNKESSVITSSKSSDFTVVKKGTEGVTKEITDVSHDVTSEGGSRLHQTNTTTEVTEITKGGSKLLRVLGFLGNAADYAQVAYTVNQEREKEGGFTAKVKAVAVVDSAEAFVSSAISAEAGVFVGGTITAGSAGFGAPLGVAAGIGAAVMVDLAIDSAYEDSSVREYLINKLTYGFEYFEE